MQSVSNSLDSTESNEELEGTELGEVEREDTGLEDGDMREAETEGKSKSKVWEYFNAVDSSSARCKLCQTIIKTSGNIINLRCHLNSKHKTFIPKELQSNSKKRSSVILQEHSQDSHIECKKLKVSQSNPVLNLFKKASFYAEGGHEAQKLTDALLYMIVVDHMPLRTVQKKGLQQFLKTARPQYTVPSRKTITKLVDDKYDVLKLKKSKNEIKVHFILLSVIFGQMYHKKVT
ncbi:E3 SUMO-protein ligase ZBED1-like [Cotesia typhae]|uniref:E3 SUMO-protein ligase ZBED1-like n=1 Tax=Cotesia typhae TaxID=2053667 RepID=UPI003D697240